MRWFKRKRKPVIVTTEVPLSTMVRWMLYDIGVNDDIDLTKMVGLMPVSKEGDDKETEDSEDRLSAVYDIFPFLDMISGMTANVLAALHCKDIKSNDVDFNEDDLNTLTSLYKTIAVSSLITSISTGVHLGLLEVISANYDLEKIGEHNEF